MSNFKEKWLELRKFLCSKNQEEEITPIMTPQELWNNSETFIGYQIVSSCTKGMINFKDIVKVDTNKLTNEGVYVILYNHNPAETSGVFIMFHGKNKNQIMKMVAKDNNKEEIQLFELTEAKECEFLGTDDEITNYANPLKKIFKTDLKKFSVIYKFVDESNIELMHPWFTYYEGEINLLLPLLIAEKGLIDSPIENNFQKNLK